MNIRFIVLVAIVLFMGLWRLVLSTDYLGIPNFTCIGAMALFGGAYFNDKFKSYLLPLASLFISDAVLMHIIYAEYSNGFLYEGWLVNYFAFAVMAFMGIHFIKRVTVKSVLLASIYAGLAHYVIVDFALWLQGGLDVTTGQPFTKDINGLLKCYTLAIPFLRNMVIGNIVYSIVFFGGFEIFRLRFPVLNRKVT